MIQRVPDEVIYMDIFIYWIITVAVIIAADLFARYKLGKDSLGYKALKIPRYIALLIGSVATILFILAVFADFKISQRTLTFFGVPYFAAWIFYITNMFRRLKAERIRRL